MLVHSALTNVKKHGDFNNALVNAVEYCSFLLTLLTNEHYFKV